MGINGGNGIQIFWICKTATFVLEIEMGCRPRDMVDASTRSNCGSCAFVASGYPTTSGKKQRRGLHINRFDKQKKQGSDDLKHISVVGGPVLIPKYPKCIYNLLISQPQCMLSLLSLLVCDSRVLALRLTDPGSPWHDSGGLSCLYPAWWTYK